MNNRELVLFIGAVSIVLILYLMRNKVISAAQTVASTLGTGLTRGLRNNNPGNIRISTIPWQGKVSPNTDGSFEQFINIATGYRNLIKNLESYIGAGYNTIPKMINEWAPEEDGNDTAAYIQSVLDQTGLSSSAIIPVTDINTLKLVAAAISRVENGIDANIDDINAGVNLL